MTLDLGPQSQKRLERLRKSLEEDSMVDVFKKALQWLEFVVDTEEAGGEVRLRLPDGAEKSILVLGTTESATKSAAARRASAAC